MSVNRVKPIIFYRANANSEIGFGHLYRGLFLKYYWECADCKFVFVTKQLSPSLKEKLSISEDTIVELSNNEDEYNILNRVTIERGKGIWVTDSDDDVFYEEKYQKTVREKGHILAIITFRNDYHFHADIVHNQNIRAPELTYSTETYTKKLLGLQYLILNPDVYEAIKSPDPIKKESILVTFGSADKRILIDRVFDFVLKDKALKKYHFDIVMGENPDYSNELEKRLKLNNIHFQIHDKGVNIGCLMKNAKLALSSGGLTAWELAVMDVPNLIIPWSNREYVTSQAIKSRNVGVVLEPEEYGSFENNLKYYLSNLDKVRDKTLNLKRMININGGFCVARKLKESYGKRSQ